MNLTMEQCIIVHLGIQAKKTGPKNSWISKEDIAEGRCTPKNTRTGVLVRLLWAALTMPDGVLDWRGSEFKLNEEWFMKNCDAFIERIRDLAESDDEV